MANIFGAYQTTQRPGQSYLQPRINLGSSTAPALSPTQAYAVKATTPHSDAHWTQQAAAYTFGGVVDVADTITAAFGQERGELNAGFWNGIGMPGMARFVEENHGGVEVAGALLGGLAIGVATEMAAVKVASSAWAATSGLARVTNPTIRAVASAQNAAAKATLAAAQSGNVLRWNEAANLRLVFAGVKQGASRAVVSEAAIVAAMHQNSVIWSDDMTQNLLMGALGVGLPSVAGAVFARGEVLRWANSDEVRLAASGAADTAAIQRAAQTLPDTKRALAAGKKPESVLPVNDSFTLTQVSLDVRLDDTTAATKRGIEVGDKRTAIKTEMTAYQQELTQRISRRGVDMAPGTGFSIKDAKGHFTSPGKHIEEALHEDPTLTLGLQSWGVADDIDEVFSARDAFRTRVMKKPGAFSRRELELLARQKKDVGLVLVGKRWMPYKDAMLYARHTPTETFVTQAIKGVDELQWRTPAGKKVRVREDGRLNVDWTTVPDTELLSVRDGMRQQAIRMARKGNGITVPKDAKFIELDYAIEVERRGGKVDWSKSSARDAGDAKLKSIQMKAEAVSHLKVLTAADRIRYNLPRQTTVEAVQDPDGVLFLGTLRTAKNAKSIEELEQIRKSAAQRFDLTTDVVFDSRLDGDIFNFGFGREDQYLKPIVGFFREPDAKQWTRNYAQEGAVEGKTIRTQQLRQAPGFVRDVVDTILTMPTLKLLQDVTGLLDSQIGGTRSVVSATAASFLTQAQRFRNHPILLAAQQYRRTVNHMTERLIDNELKAISPLIERVTSPASAKSKMLFDSYMSYAVGWDIKHAKQLPDGTVGFVLDHDSAHNFTRFGPTLAKGQMLLNPRTGQPVVLDALSNQLRVEWEKMAYKLLDSRNHVRQAMGLDPVKKRNFFVMPKSTNGKWVGFTLGPDNKVVEGGAIVATTLNDYKKQVAALKKNLKPGQRFMDREDIARYADVWDQANMDFIDPTSMAGPVAAQTGALASDFIDSTSIERMLTYMKEGYESVGNGITRTLFGEQLKIAEAHHMVAARAGRPQGVKDIHEVFMETMMGMPSKMNPTAAVRILNSVDDSIDAALEAWYPATQVPGKVMRGFMDIAGYPKDRLFGTSKKTPTFAELADDMGDYMPFKSVSEYAEYTAGVEVPWKSREMARKVNQFGAASILRWGEVTHAAMNMAGIITNLPGVVGARNVPIIGKVGGVGIVDSVQVMARGFKRMLREGDNRAFGQKFTADAKHMMDNGDMSQQAAEFDVAFGQIRPENHSAWNKFMFGTGKKGDNFFHREGLDGAISFVTDTSESLSRRWAHYTGLELADYYKIDGLEARHQFAREIANSAIANYDIWNRPEIYQNALGSMYGLFMSYAQNYYQRIWSFMEVGDYKAMGRTFAIQSAMFGFGGLPGFRQLSALFGGEEDSTSVMDGIYQRFGPAVGSIVAQGGFNQITSLLSLGHLPPMALHTRGDVNFRHPSIDTLMTGSFQLPVGLEVIRDMVSAVIEPIGAAAGPGGGRHAAEVMARHMPSRVLSGAISVVGAGGNEVDQFGNVVSSSQTMAESIYRIMGVRSARQQGEIEAYFMNQRALQIEAQRMDGVREATRAAVRANNFDALTRIFDDYLAAGGKPYNYGSWVEGIIKEAATSRGQNQLLRAMRNPGQQDLARRIELMTSAYQ